MQEYSGNFKIIEMFCKENNLNLILLILKGWLITIHWLCPKNNNNSTGSQCGFYIC